MANNEEELLSYSCLAPALKMLRRCGICPLDSNAPKSNQIIHRFYRHLNMTLILLYTILQLIYVVRVRTDIDKLMDAMFILLTYLDCICKLVMFKWKPNKILELLNILKSTSFNQGLDHHRPLLLKTAKTALFLLKLFNFLCSFISLMWGILSITLHLKNEHVEFTFWVPFDVYQNSMFYIAVCYVWLQTTWLGLNNSTMDIFIIFCYAQVKTQLSILRLDLENLVSRSKEEARTMSRSFTEALECRFRAIVHHYNEIIGYSKITEETFSAPIFFQFLASGWIICATAYRAVNMSVLSGEFLSMIMYLICILSELFLFCYYGNEVAHESEKLTESAYCMQWEEMPVKYRRYLIIFMERIKCSIQPKAGKIVPMSINTYVQVVKTSYTFYAFLNNSSLR